MVITGHSERRDVILREDLRCCGLYSATKVWFVLPMMTRCLRRNGAGQASALKKKEQCTYIFMWNTMCMCILKLKGCGSLSKRAKMTILSSPCRAQGTLVPRMDLACRYCQSDERMRKTQCAALVSVIDSAANVRFALQAYAVPIF